MQVFFFNNGNTAVCDTTGQQVPDLQQPWILLFAEFLKSKGIDPEAADFMLPSGKMAHLFRTEAGLNWRINP